jgi:uncharacterized protein YbcI
MGDKEMSEASLDERSKSLLELISNAMVHLHKQQFGRGPTKARSYFGGPNLLVCILHDVLLPAERKQVEMGQQQRVVESRTSFQAATRQEFIIAVERIMGRRVLAFASTVDPDSNVVFENFFLAPNDTEEELRTRDARTQRDLRRP